MSFADLSITRLITSLLPTEARTLSLSQGEQIRALVVSVAPSGTLQINLKGMLLSAESQIGQFKAGQIIHATVDQTTPQVVLRLVPAGAFAATPPPAWLTALLSSPAPLHTIMNGLSRVLNQRAVSDVLPKSSLEMLKALMSSGTIKPEAITSQSLRTLIDTLGYRYEPWLNQQFAARGGIIDPQITLQQNLKAHLMRLLHDITGRISHVPVQADTTNLVKQLSDLLLHIERTQVMNSMHAESGQPLTIEFPIHFGAAPSLAQLQFWQPREETADQDELETMFVLVLDLESLGPVRIESAIREKTLSITIRVTKQDVVTIAERLLPTLHETLTHRGFVVKSATCVLCSVEEAKRIHDQPPAQWPRLLDVSV